MGKKLKSERSSRCKGNKSSGDACTHTVKRPHIFVQCHGIFWRLKTTRVNHRGGGTAAPAMTATACLQLPAGEGVCTKHSPDQFGGVGGVVSDTFNRKVATSRKMSATPREDILVSVATGAVTNCVDADCADCLAAKSLVASFPAELFFCLDGPPALSN